MNYIANAFSLGMIPKGNHTLVTEDCPARPAGVENAHSIVGHQTTADLLGVPCRRESISLGIGDIVFVAQYDGPRLPEGATELPEGASFRWVIVSLIG